MRDAGGQADRQDGAALSGLLFARMNGVRWVAPFTYVPTYVPFWWDRDTAALSPCVFDVSGLRTLGWVVPVHRDLGILCEGILCCHWVSANTYVYAFRDNKVGTHWWM